MLHLKYCFMALVLAQSLACAQWTRVIDIPETRTVYALLVQHDTLYAATDSLLFIGVNGGSSWSSKNSPVSAPDVMSSLLKFGGNIMAGTYEHGIFRSTDEGSSWLPFSNGLSGLGSMDIGNILVRRDSLIAGTLGAAVFATKTDFSQAWSPLGDSLASYQGDNVFNMLVIGNTVLAGAGGNDYMFRFTDDQPWWNPVPMDTPRRIGAFVSGMASDSLIVVAGTSAGVYRSTDQGVSWERTSLSIPGQTVQVILLFHGKTLFAMTTTPLSSSFFASSDVGDTWQPLGEIPLPNVLKAAIVADTFFLATGNGLWEAPVSQFITSAKDQMGLPRDFDLYQNFHNPFNPSTEVSFQLPVVSDVGLIVYDVLGREVAVLVKERLLPGKYAVRFDGTTLASGVYFCRLQARLPAGEKDAAFTATTKLLLIR